MSVLDYKTEKVEITCPHCGEEFEKEIEVAIQESDINLTISVK